MNQIRESKLFDRWWDGHADSMENFSTNAGAFGPNGEFFEVLPNCDRLRCFKVLLDIMPFKEASGLLDAPVKLFFEKQGPKAAEDMFPNGLIRLLEDGPCLNNALHLPEDLLCVQKLLVLERHFFWDKVCGRP